MFDSLEVEQWKADYFLVILLIHLIIFHYFEEFY